MVVRLQAQAGLLAERGGIDERAMDADQLAVEVGGRGLLRHDAPRVRLPIPTGPAEY